MVTPLSQKYSVLIAYVFPPATLYDSHCPKPNPNFVWFGKSKCTVKNKNKKADQQTKFGQIMGT